MKIKKITSLILITAILSTAVLSVNAAYVGDKYISSQGACVLDFETGEVIYEYNGYTGRSPASMTKVMSLYCIYRELARQSISLNTVVPLSSKVLSMPTRTDYQCIPLYSGTRYTVDELIGAVATYSAANALLALCELVSGSEANFVALMNKTVGELGLDACYYDCCGGYTNIITPVSMAQLARRIITDYPDIIDRTSKRYINFKGAIYYSTNKLYTTYPYDGADGLKTGTSSSAGYCFCGTAVRDGRRVITVTMSSASNAYRFQDTVNLLDFGFENLPTVEGVYFTDISTYIDGFEIPTFQYNNKKKSTAVVIAEDLVLYGFDMSYDPLTRTVTAVHNPDKEFNPLAMDIYKNKKNELAFDVYDNDSSSVVIIIGEEVYNISKLYKLNGYLAISMDELASLFSYTWDGQARAGYITTKLN